MKAALARHDAILDAAVSANGGRVFKYVGDAVYAVFTVAPDALRAAIAAQRALLAESWPPPTEVRVRMALHSGPADTVDDDFIGPTLNRCARLVDLGHGGQTLLSLAAREALGDDLPPGVTLRDLASHRLRDLALPEHVYQALHPELPAEFPPVRSLDELPHNLPMRRSRFVGREREMARVQQLLEQGGLLTLTGPGGGGKTRLALQVAGETAHRYPDGVWLVALESVQEPALVPQRVAATLGVADEAGRSTVETLVDTLRPRALLLILDNCEHLIDACADLAARLLAACPRLRVLATSREALGVDAETVWAVPPMSLPDPERVAGLAGAELVAYVAQFEAVQLFMARAAVAQPGLQLDAGVARAVAEVCCRLDGMPLAIELAAARVAALSVEQILHRLDDRFRLLAAGRRDAVPRHQALRAMVDWSHDLLEAREQALLRRLAVFRGGWSLEAAEEVCSDQAIQRAEVAELLTRLVAKSLVRVLEAPRDGRYDLLNTIFEYAWEKLVESPDAAAAHERLLAWCVRHAERARAAVAGPQEAAWLGWVVLEVDNLRASMAWSTRRAEEASAAADEVLPALRLMAAVAPCWERLGMAREGLQRAARLLAAPAGGSDTEARARALVGAGRLACRTGEYTTARALADEARAVARRLGSTAVEAGALHVTALTEQLQGRYAAARDLHGQALERLDESRDGAAIAEIRHNLGAMAMEQGDVDGAADLFHSSLALRRALSDRRGVAESLNALAALAYSRGELDLAYALFMESLQLARELADRQMQALVLGNLGWLAGRRGDHAAAAPLLLESLRIRRQHADRRGMADTLLALGDVARAQGDLEAARGWFHESLALRRALGDPRGVAESLEAFARLAVAGDRLHLACRWLGAAEALREQIGSPLPPHDREPHRECVAAVGRVLEPDELAASWRAGRDGGWPAAVAQALDETPQAPAGPTALP